MALHFKAGQRYRAHDGGLRTIQAINAFAVAGEVVRVVAYTINDNPTIQQRVADRIDSWTLVKEEGSEETITLSSGESVIVDGDSIHVDGRIIDITPNDRQALIDALTGTAPKEVTL